MALPTLPSFWATCSPAARQVNEKLLARRREHEARQRAAWDKHFDYFNRHAVITTKQNAWLSDQSFQER